MILILWMVWMFFSLPWILLAGIISFSSCDPGHMRAGEYPAAIATASAFTFGPSIVFGMVLIAVSRLFRNGASTVTGSLFYLIFQVLLLIFGAGAMGFHVAAKNPYAGQLAASTWVGANLWLVGLACFVVALILWVYRERQEKGSAVVEEEMSSFFDVVLFWLVIPLRSLYRSVTKPPKTAKAKAAATVATKPKLAKRK